MRRKFLLSGAGIVLALTLCVVYIFASVLQTPLLVSRPTITVDMPRTGGLFQGSLVTYRGVRAGKVTAVQLGKHGIEATLRLDGDVSIPKDSNVKVRSLSPVGEQYLDFQPRTSHGPFLKDGDRVSASADDLPATLGAMSMSLNKLLDQVNPRKVHVVLRELSTGLAGTADDVQLLLRDGSALLRELDRYWPATERLLHNGRTLLRVGAAGSADLTRIANSARAFAAWLRANAPTLFHLLDKAPGQIEELRGLVRDVAETMPQLLDQSVTLTDVLAAHDPHIRELLVRFPQGFNALSRAIRNGNGHLDVIFQPVKTCNYDVQERSPRDTSFRALQTNGHCSRSLTISQRGAQWAPPPVGVH
jgi:phospholipid/cholesterol/gamma-HCH transport system substrate-binding protein